MRSVFWGNYKGGVGKTTSVFQIAGKFAESGKKVLLIDLDPQCSLSNICCSKGTKNLEDYKVDETFNYILELYTSYINSNNSFKLQLLMDRLEQPIKSMVNSLYVSLSGKEFKNNLFFIPSSISFESRRINELAQSMSNNSNNIFLMKLFIDDICEDFDYVFFDCPPTSNILIESVFLACHYYIVPTIIDEISTKGVPDYIAEIEKTYNKYCMNNLVGGIMMKKIFNSRTSFVGVFETIYKERRGYADNSEQISNLDKYINDLSGVKSIISQEIHKHHRYDIYVDNFDTYNIFKYYIGNKDNRSGGESIPANTANGVLTPSYDDLATALLTII
ncbi:MAG: ParA family protein [Clostridiaceae bacterium]